MTTADSSVFARLRSDIDSCDLCREHLPLGPRPVLQAHPSARILIVGQAPGTAVHKTGIPFNDPSGDRLRRWLGVNKTIFYDEQHIALVPMGFCYPGRGNGGDLPPRPECAKTWRSPLLSHLQHIELTIAVGRYAIDWHLQPNKASTLTEIVRGWKDYTPSVVPLPHPSPRNTRWLQRNPWVEAEIVPYLQQRVKSALGN
ncbi:MAG: uracil-DNA glycosylase family protein [Pseudomonadota bacterium]|nr:uracil-DNA glycosylase family protein [Pseudomonadota bacterium]MEC9154470.1 uracil-DNA glycosylase family protein [Pseudomonadota bacterium]